MLHWLGGQKTQENEAADPDATGYIEPPETPAPVFAVRAFKHALFGTPQTAQPKPRRHSNTDMTRPRQNTRPRMERPKSTNDAQTLGKLELDGEEDPLPSPTKGILLTPGTAAARRKTVSFGDNVVDNEGKRPMKSGLPDDCPGKFPSPWATSKPEQDSSDELAEKPRGRNKLTEALEQVREESAKRKSKSSKQLDTENEGDATLDLGEPRSKSGKYWKQEYDIYRERTTREVRKLVRKQKDAKDYARQKDAENTDLREELRLERKKVEWLEQRATQLEAQMRELQATLESGGSRGQLNDRPNQATNPELHPEQPTYAAMPSASNSARPVRPQRRPWRERSPEKSSITDSARTANDGRPSEPILATDQAERTRRRPQSGQNQVQDDVWAQPLASSVMTSSNVVLNPSLSRANRVGATDVDAKPLKPLSVNTLSQETRNIVLSMGMQPPSPQRENRQDSPIRSPGSPQRSPELLAKSNRKSNLESLKAPADDLSISLPISSPFQPHAAERPVIQNRVPVTVPSSPKVAAKASEYNDDPSLSLKPQVRNNENMKPSTAWQAMNGPGEPRRIVSKDTGKELDTERIERAKARMLARGRQVS